MEIRLSLAMLALLVGVVWGLSARDPIATLDPLGPQAADLSALEDAYAERRDDLPVVRRLAAEYLRLDQAALAIGVVRGASPELAQDPILTHRLAQAYEAVGRLDDALVTVEVARARCSRAVGSTDAALLGAPASMPCSPATLVALEQHGQALLQMLRWGVTDPRNDPRAPLARGLSQRRARIASLDGFGGAHAAE
jgi:hypothetical protein